MYIPNSKWTWSFVGVTSVQALISLGLESYVFGHFQSSIHPEAPNNDFTGSFTRTIPTYLSLLIFGFLYEMALVYDALKHKNTIQVIGLCLMNLGILVYTAIQKDQVNEAFTALLDQHFISAQYWPDVEPYLIAIACVVALGTVLMSFIAWKLYDEFAWTIYKQISADLRLKRRYLIYQIYIAILKFDFFLFLGFEIQFVVIVQKTSDAELYLTIASIPITIIILLFAAWCTRRENVPGMITTIVLWLLYAAYFIFKLVRMYASSAERQGQYAPARRQLTVFAVITLLLLIVTIVIAIWCTHNFNKGLKPHIQGNRSDSPDGRKQYYMDNVSTNQPIGGSRMEID